MTTQLKALCILLALFFIYYVFHNVVQRKINEKQSILWFFSGLICLVLAIFPNSMVKTAVLFGIVYKPTLLFLLGIMFSVLILFSHTIQITKHSEQNRRLAQQIGLLKLEMQELKDRGEHQIKRDEVL
jgi:hypothetical protein